MAVLGQRFLDTLRKHLELGTSLRHINMTDDQTQRVKICMELYHLRKQNPYLDISTYLTNKYNRTYWEIRSDRECLDFICSILDAGGKNITRVQVKRTYEMAAKIAYDQGDAKNMIAAAKHLSDLEKLTEPEQGEDLENSIAKLPPLFTPDARKILPGKTFSDNRKLDKIRNKWGVKKDTYQDMVDSKAEEILAGDAESSGESVVAAGFDLSSLDEKSLMELQRAVNARVMTAREVNMDDLDDDDEQ